MVKVEAAVALALSAICQRLSGTVKLRLIAGTHVDAHHSSLQPRLQEVVRNTRKPIYYLKIYL